MASQPLVYLDKDGFLSRFNLRKFSELPFHLIRARRYDDLFSEVLFNYSWLHAKLSSSPLDTVIADFQVKSILKVRFYVVLRSPTRRWRAPRTRGRC